MIYSMTGFGSARAELASFSVSVEIKSVNHRYLDVHIKIPSEYQNFENMMRQKVSGAFKRGRIDAFRTHRLQAGKHQARCESRPDPSLRGHDVGGEERLMPLRAT